MAKLRNFSTDKYVILVREVEKAFTDFVNEFNPIHLDVCLIGGLVIGIYSKPRTTTDIDLAVLDDDTLSFIFYKITINSKSKFKKISNHAIEHKLTGVTIDLCTPEFIDTKKSLVKSAIDNSQVVKISGYDMRVVSPRDYIALKLQRSDFKDLGDIETLLKSHGVVDITGLDLTEEQKENYEKVVKKVH